MKTSDSDETAHGSMANHTAHGGSSFSGRRSVRQSQFRERGEQALGDVAKSAVQVVKTGAGDQSRHAGGDDGVVGEPRTVLHAETQVGANATSHPFLEHELFEHLRVI